MILVLVNETADFVNFIAGQLRILLDACKDSSLLEVCQKSVPGQIPESGVSFAIGERPEMNEICNKHLRYSPNARKAQYRVGDLR
jgi:hypothetical protein